MLDYTEVIAKGHHRLRKEPTDARDISRAVIISSLGWRTLRVAAEARVRGINALRTDQRTEVAALARERGVDERTLLNMFGYIFRPGWRKWVHWLEVDSGRTALELQDYPGLAYFFDQILDVSIAETVQ